MTLNVEDFARLANIADHEENHDGVDSDTIVRAQRNLPDQDGDRFSIQEYVDEQTGKYL